MAIIGVHLNTNGSLNNNSVVATVMSNLGLEVYLRENGITLHRTQVGDRYVTEYMRAGSYNFGGEQSGHIILSDHSSTGDALVAALAVLAAYDGKTPFSKFATRFAAMPQILKNYRLQDWQNADELVAKAQEQATKLQTSLTGQGRVLIRKSGTEPLIRVMAEGQNQQEIENLADNIIKGLK